MSGVRQLIRSLLLHPRHPKPHGTVLRPMLPQKRFFNEAGLCVGKLGLPTNPQSDTLEIASSIRSHPSFPAFLTMPTIRDAVADGTLQVVHPRRHATPTT